MLKNKCYLYVIISILFFSITICNLLIEGRASIEDDDAVERAVRAWFRQQPKEFYAAGFQGLVKRWDKFLNLYGDYVEK